MTNDGVPGGLPPGFREIWGALREADAESPSRHVLARRLGVSTHTIQRILVDGEVPDLAHIANRRVLRAWLRIVARLAHTLGHDPRVWVEAVGVSWDEDVAGVVEDALEKITPRAPGLGARSEAEGETEAGGIEILGYEFPGEIVVGVIPGTVLGADLASSGRPFLETYLARLIGAVRPDCRLVFVAAAVGEAAGEDAAAALIRGTTGVDMLAVVADTIAGRMAGLDFVAMPGLRIRLGGLCLSRRDLPYPPPRWLETATPAASGNIRFLVPGDRRACRFLTGQCGIPEENLLVREAASPEDLAEMLVRETSLWESSIHQERWVILVCEDDLCCLVERALEGRAHLTRDYSVEHPAGRAGDYPSYQAAIAVPAHRRQIRDLLRAATGLDLLGSGSACTARLYAEMAAAGFMKRNLGNLINPCISHGPHAVADFAGAVRAFRDVFCRELLLLLEAGIRDAISSRAVFRSPAAVAAQASYLALEHARGLVPAGWETSLQAVRTQERRAGVGGDVLRIPEGHCLSCSASLLDEGHRGVSDRYCRICSDESGSLRPREEVTEILADWFARWHGSMDHSRAMREAARFMERMPAWCQN